MLFQILEKPEYIVLPALQTCGSSPFRPAYASWWQSTRVFLHRSISPNQSVQSQGSSMLVNINHSYLLGESTIVNVRNLSRQKVFLRSFISLSQHDSVLRTQKLNISIGRVVFGIRIFQVQFFFLIVWLLSSRFQTDNKKLKFQTNLIEFLSIVDIYLSYLRATFLLFSFLFIFLWLNLTNFVPRGLFSELCAVVMRYR